MYISKQATPRPIISDLPSSHKHWKERYFFVRGRHWEYNPVDQDDTLGIPTAWTAPENLCEFSVYASGGQLFQRPCHAPDFSLVALLSGIRPDLTPEDREVNCQLGKCRPRAYSDLIRSDILGSSGVSPSCSPCSTSPSPFAMETSLGGPLVVKPNWGELRARVELLVKKRSVKRKAQNPSEGSPPARGKVPNLRVSDLRSRTQVQVKGQALSSSAEVSEVVGAERHSSSTTGVKGSSRKATEHPLKFLPISV